MSTERQYTLLHVKEAVTASEMNLVINSSVMQFVTQFKDRFIVINHWPITKEEYDAYE